MNLEKLSAADFKQASEIKGQIERLEAQLASLLNKTTNPSSSSAPAPKRKKKKKMSKGARAKIAATQKLRWQERKGQLKKK